MTNELSLEAAVRYEVRASRSFLWMLLFLAAPFASTYLLWRGIGSGPVFDDDVVLVAVPIALFAGIFEFAFRTRNFVILHHTWMDVSVVDWGFGELGQKPGEWYGAARRRIPYEWIDSMEFHDSVGRLTIVYSKPGYRGRPSVREVTFPPAEPYRLLEELRPRVDAAKRLASGVPPDARTPDTS